MTHDSQSALLRAALDAAARGWHVIPLRPGDKRPAGHAEKYCLGTGRCAGGHKTPEQRATTDPELLAAAWAQERSLPVCAGSDAHTLRDIGEAWVETPFRVIRTPGDLIAALRAADAQQAATVQGHWDGKWAETLSAMQRKAPAIHALLQQHVAAQAERVRGLGGQDAALPATDEHNPPNHTTG